MTDTDRNGPPSPRSDPPAPRWYVEQTCPMGPPSHALLAEHPGKPLNPRHSNWSPYSYGPRLIAASDTRTLDELIAARRRGEHVGVLPSKAKAVG